MRKVYKDQFKDFEERVFKEFIIKRTLQRKDGILETRYFETCLIDKKYYRSSGSPGYWMDLRWHD